MGIVNVKQYTIDVKLDILLPQDTALGIFTFVTILIEM